MRLSCVDKKKLMLNYLKQLTKYLFINKVTICMVHMMRYILYRLQVMGNKSNTISGYIAELICFLHYGSLTIQESASTSMKPRNRERD